SARQATQKSGETARNRLKAQGKTTFASQHPKRYASRCRDVPKPTRDLMACPTRPRGPTVTAACIRRHCSSPAHDSAVISSRPTTGRHLKPTCPASSSTPAIGAPAQAARLYLRLTTTSLLPSTRSSARHPAGTPATGSSAAAFLTARTSLVRTTSTDPCCC